MLSVGVLQQQQAPAPAASGLRIDDLPVETMIEIISYLDFESLDHVLRVSRRLRSVIEAHWSSILPCIIERDLSPVEEFFNALQLVLLPDGASFHPSKRSSVPNGFRPPKLVLASAGFHPILNFCRAVKRWETEFQRLRFFDYPEHSRSLGLHELHRLRRALYVWWRFARRFHGTAQFGHNGPAAAGPPRPVDYSLEAQRDFMRHFSTAQLHELLDMWDTVCAVVGREVCPSVTAVREWSGVAVTQVEAARIGWGGLDENAHVLDTMMKLRPEDILHLLVYRHRYATKGSVVRFVRLRHPWIEEGIETFSEALVNVIDERQVVLNPDGNPCFPFSLEQGPDGGILDHGESETERLREVLSADGGLGKHACLHWFLEMDLSTTAKAGRLVA